MPRKRTRRHAIDIARPSNRALRRGIEEAVQRANPPDRSRGGPGWRGVTWIERDGQVIAALIPAEEVHEPGQCCCGNCPWKGDHGE